MDIKNIELLGSALTTLSKQVESYQTEVESRKSIVERFDNLWYSLAALRKHYDGDGEFTVRRSIGPDRNISLEFEVSEELHCGNRDHTSRSISVTPYYNYQPLPTEYMSYSVLTAVNQSRESDIQNLRTMGMIKESIEVAYFMSGIDQK